MDADVSYLYLFGFSPRRSCHLDRLLPVINRQQRKGEKIGIVLLHDAVIGSTSPGTTPQSILQLLSMATKVFALVPDLEARGLKQTDLLPQISPLTYDDLVDLLAGVPKVATWV